MFKALLYKLAYPLFAKEVEAYHRLNNALLGIHRWCASDEKANLISTHLLKVRDDKVCHSDHTFRERLRAIDKPTVVVTTDGRTTSVTQARSQPPKPYERPEGSKEFSIALAIQQAQQAATAIANDDNFRKDCSSHEAAWSGSDDSCSSSSGSSSSSGD